MFDSLFIFKVIVCFVLSLFSCLIVVYLYLGLFVCQFLCFFVCLFVNFFKLFSGLSICLFVFVASLSVFCLFVCNNSSRHRCHFSRPLSMVSSLTFIWLSLFLYIFSICNLNDRSWGTREKVKQDPKDKDI